MPRYIRNTAILAKIEVTPGTDSVPTGAANAMLVTNLSAPNFRADNVDRALIRPFFGSSEQLVGTAHYELGFDVELVGSGTAGSAPAWGALLRACAMAETLTAVTRADYTPITNLLEAVTIYWHDDGVLHKFVGARGSATLMFNIGERPMLRFRFFGLDAGDSAVANPTVTLTTFRTPQVVTNANTGDITLGATHSAAGAPALAAGTVYTSRGIEIELGNALAYTPLLGSEEIDLSDRQSTGTLQLDLSAAQEVAMRTSIKANTVQSLGLVHGTTAGNRALLFCPAVQFIEPTKEEINGRRLLGLKARITPLVGNDELRLVTSW